MGTDEQKNVQTDTPMPENVTEVKKAVLVEGEIKFLNRAAFRGRTPTYIKNIVKAVQSTLVAVSGLIAASDLYPPYQSKRMILFMLIGAAVAEGVGKAFGVQTAEEKQAESKK